MKFTQIAADAFRKLQLNAGVLLTEFDPYSGELDRTKIFGATGGGVSFSATPTYIDFGEDIDNVPNNTKELKQLDYFTATLSGTLKTVDTEAGKALIAAADIDDEAVIPRSTLSTDDFVDIWWVGDYSDVTTGANAGFLAIHVIDALSTGGFRIQSNDKGKGDFAFEFTGHYSLEDIDKVPFELYISQGDSDESEATLSALTVGAATLVPTFDPDVYSYEVETSNATNTVTATPEDSGAAVVITVNGSSISSGSSVSWQEGENEVVVVVSNGGSKRRYEISVTYSA